MALGSGCDEKSSTPETAKSGGPVLLEAETGFKFNLSSFARGEAGAPTTGGLTRPQSDPIGGLNLTVQGEVLAVRLDNGDSQRFKFALVIDDATIEITTTLPPLPLTLGAYKFYFLMKAGGQQYAGITPIWLIIDGHNAVTVDVNPVLGQAISDVAQLGTLSEFNFQLDAELVKDSTDPRLGLTLGEGEEISFAVNKDMESFAGDTPTVKVLVFLPAGPAQVQARFYDGSELQAASPPEQKDVEITEDPGVFQIDVVPVKGQTNYTYVPASQEAVFHLVVPGVVFDVAGGESNVQAMFSLVGPENELHEFIGDFRPSGANYETNVVIPNFAPGSVTWQLSFADISFTPALPYGSCGQTITVTGDPVTLFCDFTLWAKPVPQIPSPGRVLVTVSDGSPVAGAIVTANNELVGITHADTGALEFLLRAGTYTIAAVRADGSDRKEAGLTVEAGGEHEVHLVIPPPPLPPPLPPPQDTRAPVVHISAPTGVTNDQTPRLDYTTDEAGTVTVLLENSPVSLSKHRDLPFRDDGTYDLKVEVEDAAGNVGQDTVTFTIDTQAPPISIQEPTGATNSREPMLRYTTDGLVTDVVLGTLSVDTRNNQTLPEQDEGEYTITVHVKDAVGNQSSTSATFSVDLTPPPVSIFQPSGTVNVADPVMEYLVSEPGTVAVITLAGPAGVTTVTTGNRQPLEPLADGEYTLRVQATDAVGNQTTVSRIFNVDTSPAPIAILKPKGITPNNRPVLEYELGEPGTVTVVLDDAEVTVANGGNLHGPDNAELADGEHTVTVMVIDTAGNRSQASVTFDVNATAPAITIVQPVGVTNSREPMLEYSTSEAGDAAVTLDGGPLAIHNRGTLSGPDGPLADGTHKLKVSITDQLGRVAFDISEFRVDTLPPRVEISAPTGLTTDPAPMLEFSVEDADEHVSWTVSLDGHDLEFAPGNRLPEKDDGEHTVRVVAQDSVGNASSVSAKYHIDTKDPVVTISKPDGRPTRDNTPLLEYTTDERGAETVLLDKEPVSTRNGQELRTALGKVLSDGPHTVEVKVVDAAMHSGRDVRKFSVDATAPKVTIQAPEEDRLINRSFVDLVFKSNEDGLAVVEINEARAYSLSAEADHPVTVRMGPLAGGLYKVRISVTDKLGNKGDASVAFFIDHRAPAVDISSPKHGSVTNQRRPLLVYAVDEEGPVEVFLNGKLVTTGNGDPLTSPEGGDLADGKYTVTVKALDTAGNMGKAEITFTVDATAPLVTIEYPGDGSAIASATPVVVFSSGETGSAGVSLNGSDPATLPVVGGVRVRIQVGPLAEGINKVTVKVNDANGNVRSASSSFTVDTRAPVVSIQQPGDESDDEEPLLVFTYDEPGTVLVLLDSKEIRIRSGDELPHLKDGTHTVEVQVTDAVGNMGSDSLTFTVDPAQPPQVFDLTAKRVRRPTHREDGVITFDGKATVEIPDTSAITVLSGNNHRYLALLKLGKVSCVYLGGDYNAPFGGEPEWDLFKLFRSPVCGLGKYKAGDRIKVKGSVSLRVLFGDPDADVTKVQIAVPILETSENFAITDEEHGHRHGSHRWHDHEKGKHGHEHHDDKDHRDDDDKDRRDDGDKDRRDDDDKKDDKKDH